MIVAANRMPKQAPTAASGSGWVIRPCAGRSIAANCSPSSVLYTEPRRLTSGCAAEISTTARRNRACRSEMPVISATAARTSWSGASPAQRAASSRTS